MPEKRSKVFIRTVKTLPQDRNFHEQTLVVMRIKSVIFIT